MKIYVVGIHYNPLMRRFLLVSTCFLSRNKKKVSIFFVENDNELVFYLSFNIILVISKRGKIENERPSPLSRLRNRF